MGPTKLVLFVSVENSNRSQMAEAFARMHAGDGFEAASSGSRPSGRVNPRAVEYMREVGYDLTTHTSKPLDQFNGQKVEVAVTLLRNIHGVAPVGELDGDEIGFLAGKVAEIKRLR